MKVFSVTFKKFANYGKRILVLDVININVKSLEVGGVVGK